jgi:hypothetical protein
MDDDATQTGPQDRAESRESDQISPPGLDRPSRDETSLVATPRAQRGLGSASMAAGLTTFAEMAAQIQRDLDFGNLAAGITPLAEMAAQAQRDQTREPIKSWLREMQAVCPDRRPLRRHARLGQTNSHPHLGRGRRPRRPALAGPWVASDASASR